LAILEMVSTHSSIKFFARTLDRCIAVPFPNILEKSMFFWLNESDLTLYVGILLRHMPSALRIVLIDPFLESNRFEEYAMNPLPRQKFYAKKFDDDDFVVGHLSWKIWVPATSWWIYNFVSFNKLFSISRSHSNPRIWSTHLGDQTVWVLGTSNPRAP